MKKNNLVIYIIMSIFFGFISTQIFIANEHLEAIKNKKTNFQIIDNNNVNLEYFRIGSSAFEVLKLMGNPIDTLYIDNETEWWYYGNSKIKLKNNIVIEVEDKDKILKFEEKTNE